MNTQQAHENAGNLKEFAARPAVAATILAAMTAGELYLVYRMIEYVVAGFFGTGPLPVACL